MDCQDDSLEQRQDSILEEAEQLIWGLLDDKLEEADIKRLEDLLRTDERVRKHYIECVRLNADLSEFFNSSDDKSLPPDKLKSPVLGSLGELRPDSDPLPSPENL